MIVKKIFYKTTIYLVILNLFILTALFVSVSAYFIGGAKKPDNVGSSDYLTFPNYPYFRYKKYYFDIDIAKHDIILSSDNKKLYYANKELPMGDQYHSYNSLYPGNYKMGRVRKNANYYQIGNEFYPRNVYHKGDYVYDMASKKLYKRLSDVYYPNIVGDDILNKDDAPGKSSKWMIDNTTSHAVWKRYNIYRKNDIVFFNSFYYYVKNDFSAPFQEGAQPGTYSNSNWGKIENVVASNFYPKHSIVKTSDNKFYQAKKLGANGNYLTNDSMWQEIYPRI